MQILNTTTQPYLLSPSKTARTDIKNELERLRSIPELHDQDTGRVLVLIGNQKTYWARGLSAGSPLMIQHTVKGIRRVHVLAPDQTSVAVYDSQGRDIWERRALLRESDQILSSLPKRAVVSEIPIVPASEKQVAVLKKVLDLSADEPFPKISSAVASRLIDRVTIERTAAAALLEDLILWKKELLTGVTEQSAA